MIETRRLGPALMVAGAILLLSTPLVVVTAQMYGVLGAAEESTSDGEINESEARELRERLEEMKNGEGSGPSSEEIDTALRLSTRPLFHLLFSPTAIATGLSVLMIATGYHLTALEEYRDQLEDQSDDSEFHP